MSPDQNSHDFADPEPPASVQDAGSYVEQDGSDYGDLGNDEEELGIIEHLLTQLDPHSADAQLRVTDIEDYEPPLGVRLPKILGVEQSTRQWEVQASLQSPSKTVRGASDANCACSPSLHCDNH